MTIYVGKWSLLPQSWEGYNGLIQKSRDEVYKEIRRQHLVCGDSLIDTYTPKEFEEMFNQDLEKRFNTEDYFIRII